VQPDFLATPIGHPWSRPDRIARRKARIARATSPNREGDEPEREATTPNRGHGKLETGSHGDFVLREAPTMSNLPTDPNARPGASGTPNNASGSPANAAGGAAIQLKGGAAILAPVTAFPNGVPGNALVLMPINPNGTPFEKKVVEGPVALTMDEVWKLLGFNGPAVQVQDEQGRPIAIGLEDLLGGLEKHWNDGKDDLQRGRVYGQELMKYGRAEKAEKVYSKIVALGGDGEDWLALGVSQLAQKKLDKAEATLKGAQNLLKDSPIPSIQLARTMKEKGDRKAERECATRAIQIDNNSVDAWAYFANSIRETSNDDAMVREIEELANAPVNAKSASPYIALQGFFAADPKDEAARERAIGFAKKAVERAPGDPLALVCLSALYGQGGKIDDVVKLLAPHEALMLRDVRIAHNYFEALMARRDMQKITALLNKLATSQVRDVKQFAIERSRAISQMLAQQQQQLAGTAQTRA
jgi:tetratricopeptide (TPR) repeat protein